jgi:hypothetical protein
MAVSVPSIATIASSSAAVVADFDTEGDVLYVSLGQPVASYGEEQPEGIVLRWAYTDNRPSGVTVIGYRQYWLGRRKALAERVGKHLGVAAQTVKVEISRVT